MKRCLMFLAALILFVPLSANAIPMYYQFEGTVSDWANPSWEDGIANTIEVLTNWDELDMLPGNKVYHTVTIDFDDVFYDELGEINVYSAEYICGSRMPAHDLIYQHEGSEGRGNWPGNPDWGLLFTSSPTSYPDNLFLIYNLNIALSDWDIGTQVRGYHFMGPSGADIYEDLTLVSITDDLPSIPVPEPATVLLLWTGLVGLVGLRRKFKK
jgi:hypothetical protein